MNLLPEKRRLIPLLLFLLALICIHGYAYGRMQNITGLTIFPSLPEPGQKVMLRAYLHDPASVRNEIIKVSDVFGKEIAHYRIQDNVSPEGYIDIPFNAPAAKGRYNYNVMVSLGDTKKFINIPVSSKPVNLAIVEGLAVRFEASTVIFSFHVKNNGNQDVHDLTVGTIINPGIGRFAGKDITEFLVEEKTISTLLRDESVKFEVRKAVSEIEWLRDKRHDVFWLGVNLFGIGEKPYWKIEKIKLMDGKAVIIPLHSLPAHTFYTENAIDIFLAGSTIYQELSLYKQQLIDGSYNEDYPPDLVYNETWPFLYIHHFLDYDNHPFFSGLSGTGLYIPLITSNYVESAYEKAMAYGDGWTLNSVYYPGVVELYLGIGIPYPDKITAYEYLGRIAHLIEDMLTPAHTHSDMHGILIDDDEFEEVYEPSIDPDTGRPRYEKYDENSAVWAYWRDYIGNRNFTDFAELFTKINNHTDYFPSDDYEGDAENFSNPWNIPRLYRTDIIYYDFLGIDHYKLPGMKNLADWMSPLNVMSVSATYKFFWDNTH